MDKSKYSLARKPNKHNGDEVGRDLEQSNEKQLSRFFHQVGLMTVICFYLKAFSQRFLPGCRSAVPALWPCCSIRTSGNNQPASCPVSSSATVVECAAVNTQPPSSVRLAFLILWLHPVLHLCFLQPAENSKFEREIYKYKKNGSEIKKITY